MSEQQNIKNAGTGCGIEPVSPAPTCQGGQTYSVRPGDTMYFIAKRFNISLQSLINANPQITDANLIFPGQVICVPVASSGPFCPNGQMYTVVSGDTIYEIARRFGISMDALIQANPQINDPNLIFPGQEICVPVTSVPPVLCPMGTLYTVKAGDTMFEIARRNNIPLAVLINANPQIDDPNLIFPGQIICVPSAPMPIAPPTMPEMPLPLPIPMPLPVPIPMPAPPPPPPPAPRPLPAPAPLPMPAPCPRTPVRPCPMPAPMPMPMPMPAPAPMPMPMPMPMPPTPGPGEIGGMPSMYPMPVYIVVPWEECPFKPRKKKRDRHCRR